VEKKGRHLFANVAMAVGVDFDGFVFVRERVGRFVDCAECALTYDFLHDVPPQEDEPFVLFPRFVSFPANNFRAAWGVRTGSSRMVTQGEGQNWTQSLLHEASKRKFFPHPSLHFATST
jgi:hypothetical protein